MNDITNLGKALLDELFDKYGTLCNQLQQKDKAIIDEIIYKVIYLLEMSDKNE